MTLVLSLSQQCLLPVFSRGRWVVVGITVVGRWVDGCVGLSTGVVCVGVVVTTGPLMLRNSQTRRQLSTVKNLLALPLQPPYVNCRHAAADTS